jgi:hypothetical protein
MVVVQVTLTLVTFTLEVPPPPVTTQFWTGFAGWGATVTL